MKPLFYVVMLNGPLDVFRFRQLLSKALLSLFMLAVLGRAREVNKVLSRWDGYRACLLTAFFICVSSLELIKERTRCIQYKHATLA